MKALQIIEEVYDTVINHTQDYFTQLEPLAPNGELANRISANKVLFKLCQLVDDLEGEIKKLKDDRQAIAAKMIELDKKINPHIVSVDVTNPDPTKPITNSSL